jgi:hypothetical protein
MISHLDTEGAYKRQPLEHRTGFFNNNGLFSVAQPKPLSEDFCIEPEPERNAPVLILNMASLLKISTA